MTRANVVFLVLGGFFITNAIVAEMIGSKLIYVGSQDWKLGPFGPFAMSVGIIPWPVVFLTTDLVNEYFGRRGVRRLSLLTAGMIAYVFLLLQVTMSLPAAPGGIDDASFNNVFGPGQSIIVGSLLAFLIGQLVDVTVFHALRRRSGKSMLWLRATGSTVVSQLIDTLVVLYIGLAIPFDWDLNTYLRVAIPNYVIKLTIAILMTPVIYLLHGVIERFLGHAEADELAAEAARDSA